jgi:hypothetical protein
MKGETPIRVALVERGWLVPFERVPHFDLEAIVGSQEIRAYEQQDYVGGFEVFVDLPGEVLTGRNAPVMPGCYGAVPLEHGKMRFQLVSKLFVPV